MDHVTYPARRAKPGMTFAYTGPDGEQRELVADKSGLVTPETAEDVAILDTFDLPHARTHKADEPADVPRETPDKTPAETGAEG